MIIPFREKKYITGYIYRLGMYLDTSLSLDATGVYRDEIAFDIYKLVSFYGLSSWLHACSRRTVVRVRVRTHVRIRACTVAMIRIMTYARMRGTSVSMSRRSAVTSRMQVVKTKLEAHTASWWSVLRRSLPFAAINFCTK